MKRASIKLKFRGLLNFDFSTWMKLARERYLGVGQMLKSKILPLLVLA